MIELTVTASYDSPSDLIEVSVYKHDGNTILPISSGVVSLLQNGDLLQSIEVSASTQTIRFYHPPYLRGLTVEADVDTYLKSTTVLNTPDHKECYPSDFEQPTIDEETRMEYDTYINNAPTGERREIDTTKLMRGSIILDADFNLGSIPFNYEGGNRIVFDFDGQLAHQPLNTLIDNIPVYSEVATTNLLDTTDLLSNFNFIYEFGGLSPRILDDYGYPHLRVKSLGGSQGDVTASTIEIQFKPVLNGKSIAFFFGFDQQIVPDTFDFITEIVDNTNTVIETQTQTFNTADFLNLSMIYQTMTAVGSLQARIVIDGVSNGDIFNMDILLPQITDLDYITSYTPDNRVADVFTKEITIDETTTTFEIDFVASGDRPCTLFNFANIIEAYYTGTDLVFDVNGTIATAPALSLLTDTLYSFSFDNEFEEVIIKVNDIPAVVVSTTVTLPTTTGMLYVGSDENGLNQINCQLNKFRVLK